MAFARTVALQLTEWLDYRATGGKVWWTVREYSGKKILAVYFYAPGHEIGFSDVETPTLDGVPLSQIVIETAKK